jgi:two-component system, sensor histidine kinase and response regulator
LVAPEAEGKRIHLFNQIAESISGYGDLNMIRLVMRNLISNALKFTRENGEIRIDCRQSNDELEITVMDNGVGIPEETLPLLFRLDEHYSTEGTRNERGSGLGLILCKEFVEENGGRIWVESRVGEGSRFQFTLPPYTDDSN